MGLWNPRFYYHTNYKILENTVEAEMMRRFFRIRPEQMKNGSCLIHCKIAKGRIRNSLLIDVIAEELEADHSLIIHSEVGKAKAVNSLLYNVMEDDPISIENRIRADLFFPESEQQVKLYTQHGRDGKDDWNIRLDPNPYSYAELYELCKDVDLAAAKEMKKMASGV